MARLLAPTALAGLLAVGGSAAVQTPEQTKPEVVIPVGTEVVRVDVIVTDKGGKARAGLRREDFQILEDGQPQPITRFEAFAAAGATPGRTARPGTIAAAEPAPPPERSIPRRFVLLAVDDIHIEAANLMRLKKTLDRYLESDVAPEDVVALVTMSGARVQDFTEDRLTLRLAVSQLTVQYRRLPQVDVPYVSDYQAELIMRNDPEALQVAVEEIQASRRSPNPVEEARSVARAVVAESIHNSRITFETLQNAMLGMGRLPGRKVIVFVSDGFTSGFGVESRAALDLRQITDAGTRAGVIVYSLDSRGLQANGPGHSASDRGSVAMSQGAVMSARERIARQGELAAQDAMNAMAAETGGFLVANTNNFGDALRRIVRDTDSYYVLAYEPANAKHDGSFRKIEVRLAGVKDVRIRHRKGYYAADERRPGLLAGASAAGAGRAGAPASPVDSLLPELRTALTSPAPMQDLPVSLSADFVSTQAGVTQVVVSGYVDLHDVPFVRTGDRRLAQVDIAGAVFDESGAAVGSLAVERASLDLTQAAYEVALEEGLRYQRAAPLKRGRYRVVIAVREQKGGKVGNATQWVEIPDLGRGRVALSSLFLMKEGGAAKAPSAPERPSLRSVQAHRVYGQEESLHVEFFAYNLELGARQLLTQTEIWSEGVLLAATPPQPLEAHTGAPSTTAYTREIKLRPFAPGDYEVRVVVRDAQTDEATSQRASFRIE